MSQYHHARGQWPEWPAQVPPAQRPSFSPPGLVAAPTGYEGPADATSVAANYVASQNSFDFNAARIPGLGITDPSPVENNEYSPTLPGWGYTPSDTAAGPAAPAPARRKNHTPRAPMHRSSPREVHRPVPPPRARAAGPPNRPGGANDSAVEEGELSEGQFEDLYEPPKTIDSAPPRDRALIQRALDHDSRGTSENYLRTTPFTRRTSLARSLRTRTGHRYPIRPMRKLAFQTSVRSPRGPLAARDLALILPIYPPGRSTMTKPPPRSQTRMPRRDTRR